MYGVKTNVKAPHKFLRMGGLCWVLQTNNGGRNDRFMVRGISRGGRKVDAWLDARDLGTFRAGWFADSEEFRFAFPFGSREEAQAWAADMNARFGIQPVRRHAAALGLLPIGPHDHPDPHTMVWSESELRAIRNYAARCVVANGAKWRELARTGAACGAPGQCTRA